MEVKFLTQTAMRPWPALSCKLAGPVRIRARATVTDNTSLVQIHGDEAATLNTTHVYNDSWFDRMAIDYLSSGVQSVSGLRNQKSGFDSLMEVTAQVYRKFNAAQQCQIVVQVLEKAVPNPILYLIRTMMPNSKIAREYFAVFTTLFFAWLVGPCEVKESELNGAREKNVVHIKKCRILEHSNCVGMCVNMCKMPSQTFINNSFGIPVNMVPNFEDMSCEMIFGEHPPAPNNDPALSQPCYKLCKEKSKHIKNCTG